MSEKFQPGQVWEMRDWPDEVPYFVFRLLEKLPPQDNGPRFGVSNHTWNIFVLMSDTSIGLTPAGTYTATQLDGIAFLDNGDVGYSSYDSMYVRLA